MSEPRRFMAVYDVHRGWESRGGHRKAIHDPKAWSAVVKFAQDFKPQDFIFGGDILDCGCISHHNKGKARKTEGMRLLRDAEDCAENVIKPIEETLVRGGRRDFIVGNHEDWLEDLVDIDPALEGLVDVNHLLGLDAWKVIPQGGHTKLGKLHFIHGDQLGGGEHAAKKAALDYGKSVRFGHFHTFAAYTKTSPVDTLLHHSAVSVPCLCVKDPAYNESKPSRWAQGFLWGYINEDGTFNDYVSIVVDGQFTALGRTYRG